VTLDELAEALDAVWDQPTALGMAQHLEGIQAAIDAAPKRDPLAKRGRQPLEDVARDLAKQARIPAKPFLKALRKGRLSSDARILESLGALLAPSEDDQKVSPIFTAHLAPPPPAPPPPPPETRASWWMEQRFDGVEVSTFGRSVTVDLVGDPDAEVLDKLASLRGVVALHLHAPGERVLAWCEARRGIEHLVLEIEDGFGAVFPRAVACTREPEGYSGWRWSAKASVRVGVLEAADVAAVKVDHEPTRTEVRAGDADDAVIAELWSGLRMRVHVGTGRMTRQTMQCSLRLHGAVAERTPLTPEMRTSIQTGVVDGKPALTVAELRERLASVPAPWRLHTDGRAGSGAVDLRGRGAMALALALGEEVVGEVREPLTLDGAFPQLRTWRVTSWMKAGHADGFKAMLTHFPNLETLEFTEKWPHDLGRLRQEHLDEDAPALEPRPERANPMWAEHFPLSGLGPYEWVFNRWFRRTVAYGDQLVARAGGRKPARPNLRRVFRGRVEAMKGYVDEAADNVPGDADARTALRTMAGALHGLGRIVAATLEKDPDAAYYARKELGRDTWGMEVPEALLQLAGVVSGHLDGAGRWCPTEFRRQELEIARWIEGI
jgi:hypothetical protein